ncbi:zincin-like metallopeptidase domain-containing protein (plasmid) [Agrobacterium tumefaciens]|uniref:ArdC family protein n=1 Tax=Agrobacterium tumefaciens TaxID=358 RepID=UPI0015748D62|nr:zincin-like metallopeptidase domain-containing protein [Agrobacterium tumefaciens]WCJ66132.1 zincin-like metallopeptidase domain-containing protein [Agrobacterium tumefaciens]WCK17190.1 zincin-like metallopeptidase domain-containing protein [Agrobacterium tumefaciens]
MQSKDTYQRITDAIIEQLEAGTKPWIRPWRGTVRRSPVPQRATGEAYRGINVIMLWLSSQLAGYDENTWMTYRQAQDLGGQVRKGEQGTLVVKYGTFTPKEQEADDKSIPYLKGYTVFNVEQIDGLPDHFKSPVEDIPVGSMPLLGHVEDFIGRTAAKITYGGKQACYRPGPDDIEMPARERFLSEVHLYSTVLHELGHWTGAKHRLNRDLSGRFGTESYAVEELVAELSAAFVCADLGVEHDPRENTATYLESWLKVLKQDKRAIVTAAAKAQAVADYLHSLQGAMDIEAA